MAPPAVIVCGSVEDILPRIHSASMVFADPPDNIDQHYMEYLDEVPDDVYMHQMCRWLSACVQCAPVAWFSYNAQYHRLVHTALMRARLDLPEARRELLTARLFVWRFTFGQHRNSDCGNGYRPILRVAPGRYPWRTSDILVESKRQQMGDKRAKPGGKVPDDVWDFSRICGTFHERRDWSPNQHPQSLVERAIRLSTLPGELIVDAFSGTGTTLRAALATGRRCIAVEQSMGCCERIAQDTGVPIWNGIGEFLP